MEITNTKDSRSRQNIFSVFVSDEEFFDLGPRITDAIVDKVSSEIADYLIKEKRDEIVDTISIKEVVSVVAKNLTEKLSIELRLPASKK